MTTVPALVRPLFHPAGRLSRAVMIGNVTGGRADFAAPDRAGGRGPSLKAQRDDGTRSRTGPRVLVVEDNRIVRDILVFGLRRHEGTLRSATVDVVEEVEGAWALLNSREYVLAVIDLYLPGASGAELVKRIRASPALAALPVLGISIGGEQARQTFMAAGADGFLSKPILIADFVGAIESLLTGRTGADAEGPAGAARRRILLVDDSPLAL